MVFINKFKRSNAMHYNLCRVVIFFVGLSIFGSPLNAADLLSQSADMSSRAIHSVMLSLARAGERIVAVGERGFVLTSDDQGQSWQQVPVPVSVTLTSVFFITPKKGWITGHGGVVLGSDDGGSSWRKLLDGKQAAQIELTAAVAANDQSRRALRRVREAELLVESGPDKPFLNVYFFNENNGLIVGAYGLIFITEDAGKSWRSLMGSVPNYMGMHLYDIHHAGDYIYLTGEQGVLFRSGDEGGGFEQRETPYGGSFFGMQSSIKGDLVLFGLRGNVLRSTDEGEHWEFIELTHPVTLTAGARLKNGDLVLVDETGQVLLSRDRGLNFLSLPVTQASAFTDVVEVAEGVLIISGVRGLTRIEIPNLTAGNP